MAFNFKTTLRNIKNYFNPDNADSFWGTPLADSLTATQKFVQSVPERPVKFNTVLPNSPTPVRFVANLPQTIVSETLNLPNRIVYNANRIGTARTKNDFYRGVAGAGEALFDIATLGFGSSLTKQGIKQLEKEGVEQVGKRTFKQMLGEVKARPVQELTKSVLGSEGLRLGASQGPLVAIRSLLDQNPNATTSDIMQAGGAGLVTGGTIGLVAEPAIKYGTQAIASGAKKAGSSVSDILSKYAVNTADDIAGASPRILPTGKNPVRLEPLVKSANRFDTYADFTKFLADSGQDIKSLTNIVKQEGFETLGDFYTKAVRGRVKPPQFSDSLGSKVNRMLGVDGDEAQAGYIDFNEIGDAFNRLVSGQSKALDEKPVQKSIGKKLPKEVAERVLKNPTDDNIKALQSIYNDLSRSTLYKSFDEDTALRALGYYVNQLGGDAVNKIKKETFGKQVMKGELVKQFWSTLRDQTAQSTGKSYKLIEQEANETLLKTVDDIIGNTSNAGASLDKKILGVERLSLKTWTIWLKKPWLKKPVSIRAQRSL